MNADTRYSVIVPVYKNEDSVENVIDVLSDLSDSFQRGVEAVFVIDGSPDGSAALLRRRLADARLSSQVIELTRNFGSFSAIRVGLSAARGDYVAVMAADLQEPISVVRDFFTRMESGSCDVVIGQRTARSDPAMATAGASMYWTAYRRFVNREIPPGGVDVFGCTKPVAEVLAAMSETHTSLVGLLFWVGYRREYVEYERQARHSGRSSWTLRRKARYLFDSVYAFTDLPIVALQTVGFIGTLASMLVGIVVFIAWLTGSIGDPGYTPLMLVLVGTSSAILLGLGVVGSYVWRAYENGKNRPFALVMRHDDFGPTVGQGNLSESDRT